ncbi:MAG: protein phosphatase CheZ [Bacteroidota bacterium]
MSAFNVNEILGKINELRAVFVLGQRAVPFLEEVFQFLKEIAPLFDDISASIQESTGKMPHAKSQLESVTQATEVATTEIMDRVDTSTAELGRTKKEVLRMAEQVEALRRADAQVIRILRRELADQPRVLARLELLHEEKKSLRLDLSHTLEAQVDVLKTLRNSMNSIMMSLQVQDITTQQISAVNHLIESVRERMATLNQRLGIPQPGAANDNVYGYGVHSRVDFDPNARYSHSHSASRQEQADQLISSFDGQGAPAPAPSEAASADDIDALFGGGAPAAAPSEAASADDIDALFGGGAPAAAPSEAASADDIDALFGGGAPAAPSEPASQDDIDALFGG